MRFLVTVLPAVWASLVITAGPAAADALEDWSSLPRTVASLMLWAAWAGVLLATLVPRPLGLTALRLATPLGVGLALWASASTSGVKAAVAVAATLGAAGLAFTPSVAARFVNGAAYGDERRFPLRVPPALLLGTLPLAVVMVGLGTATGPLLLADGRELTGAVASLIGLPIAAAMTRSLYALSQRWAVLVPAGIVLKDPLTLVDPVLFPRDRVASLRPLPYPRAPAEDILDLRLGAGRGSLVLELTDEAMLVRSRGRVRGGEIVHARRVAFSPTDPAGLMADASRRRTAAAG